MVCRTVKCGGAGDGGGIGGLGWPAGGRSAAVMFRCGGAGARGEIGVSVFRSSMGEMASVEDGLPSFRAVGTPGGITNHTHALTLVDRPL